MKLFLHYPLHASHEINSQSLVLSVIFTI
ncbi:hypothetical protein BLOT_016703 [Blomia tropicalis]|nr:hypothetical protein BLOT_016703 [Blomia tropicalis]